jgi:hypothetical protein
MSHARINHRSRIESRSGEFQGLAVVPGTGAPRKLRPKNSQANQLMKIPWKAVVIASQENNARGSGSSEAFQKLRRAS